MLKLKVRTLDKESLANASVELAMVAGIFKPDLIIGIRSGGHVVAQEMAAHFPAATLLPITCRRPSTKKKQASGVKKLLNKLPDAITSRLRIIEHIVLTRLRPARHGFIPDEKELATIENHLRKNSNARILIVDDAVDSGATLAATVKAVESVAGPNAPIKTAVITVTTATPFIEPTFSLYRYVLCRFPWSLDFKN